RVVKTIGDAVLFVADDAATGARIATGLARGTAVEGPVPVEVRVSVVWGRVLSRFGDVFGPPVNLAARLSAAAEPGTVLTDPVTAVMFSGVAWLAVLVQEPAELVGCGAVTPFRVGRRYSPSARSSSSGPFSLTRPTAAPTGRAVSSGGSVARIGSASAALVAGSSHASHVSRARITGWRSWISARGPIESRVMIVVVTSQRSGSSSALVGSFQNS